MADYKKSVFLLFSKGFLLTGLMPMLAYGTSFVVEEGQIVGQQVMLNLSDTGLVEEGGAISTSANGAAGVLMQNGLQELTNNGTIKTTGSSANGAFSFGPSSLITNNGLIRTTGPGSIGIISFSTGTGSTVINKGSILIEGAAGNGIFLLSTGSKAVNNGEIRTMGVLGAGIVLQGAFENAINNGFIQSTGPGSFGVIITALAPNSTLTNNGTIIANSDPTSFAISLQALNTTLNLQRESNIQGAVQLTQASALNVQKGLNLSLTTTGLPFTTITTEGDPFVTSGNQVAVVDRTGFAMEVDILDDLTAVIMNNLGSQYCLDCCDNGSCCGAYELDNDWSAWIRGFGSYRERRLQHRTVKFDNGLEGGMAGLETPIFCDWKLGLFGGGSYGTSHVKHHSHVYKNTSGFGGLYLDGSMCGNFVRFAVSGGSLNQHSRRKVMNNLAADGYQYARTKLHGGFVAPELRIGRSFCLFGLNPIVSADVRYSGLFLDHYKEKGSNANFRVKDHDIHLLTVSSELAVPISFEVCDSCMTVTPYAGLEGRFRLGDKKLHGELLDQSVVFYDGSWNDIGSVFIGVRSCRVLDCGLSIMLDLEGNFDNHKSALVRGGLKAEMSF